METILIRALQLVLSLSLLVFIHEGGHFLFAKMFKIRVEKFRLFFDPWFTLFKYKPRNSDTEYGIGWLPLGGYVKIAGMIDESMDKEQLKQAPQPWEFRSRPPYQRLLVMVAGVLFNFLLALFVYSMILLSWGDKYIPLQNMSHGMEFNEHAEKIGFRDGDILLSADSVAFERFGIDMLRTIVDAKEVVVLRAGEKKTVYMPELSLLTVTKEAHPFISIRIPAVVDSVYANSAAERANLKKGDRLVALSGNKINSWNEFRAQLKQMKMDKNASRSFELCVDRSGQMDTLQMQVDSTFTLGCLPQFMDYEPLVTTYTLFSSIPAGVKMGINTLKSYVNDMKYVFSKEGADSLGGFGTIASIFPAQWDWYRFWSMTAFLSIVLAFMNILPIPALDGGHIFFLLIEMITRRTLSEKFMEYAQMAGMILLFGLLIWANLNDVLRLF
ncbi:MAG: RIP metalloprotease RseP [Bacteroidaceae bacterium]|nr:RIP metalloprotease RseP [Bacteroidaceae bacterium]